jgi:toluene monooxygenase system ferredoxin subunit
MDELTFLSQVGLFKDLGRAELEKILPLCRKDHQGPGERIFSEGDNAEDVGIIIQGEVNLRFEMPGRETDQEHTLSVVPATKTFGWSALVPPHQFTLSSYAGPEGCQFYRIRGQDMIRLFDSNHRLGYIVMRNLNRVIAKRFHQMEDEIVQRQGHNLMHNW